MKKALPKKFHQNIKRNYMEMMTSSSTNYSSELATSQTKKLKIKSTKFKDVKIFSPEDETKKCKVEQKNQEDLHLVKNKKPRSVTCRKLLPKSSNFRDEFYTSKRKNVLNSKTSSHNTEFKIDEILNKKKKM
jgi:hypothetical protein